MMMFGCAGAHIAAFYGKMINTLFLAVHFRDWHRFYSNFHVIMLSFFADVYAEAGGWVYIQSQIYKRHSESRLLPTRYCVTFGSVGLPNRFDGGTFHYYIALGILDHLYEKHPHTFPRVLITLNSSPIEVASYLQYWIVHIVNVNVLDLYINILALQYPLLNYSK